MAEMLKSDNTNQKENAGFKPAFLLLNNVFLQLW